MVLELKTSAAKSNETTFSLPAFFLPRPFPATSPHRGNCHQKRAKRRLRAEHFDDKGVTPAR
ncbi:hypothetical protein L6Q21_17760 [Sandaracinobacter sp. RS1-74]|nr:hypothetical protein [Sandaracinobacteroides sayramensis]